MAEAMFERAITAVRNVVRNYGASQGFELEPVEAEIVVRAVLKAIREPAKEMVWAGAAVQDHCTDVDQIYAAMIDGALNPDDVAPHRLYLDLAGGE